MRRVLPALLAVALTLGAVAGPAVADELEQRRSELAEAGRTHAQAFTWRRCATRTRDVYQSLVNS